MSTSPDCTRVLFICLGNICRSPLAEGIFLHQVNARGVADRFHIDSAGTGAWHVGEPADPRAQEVARKHGVILNSRARQVRVEDFDQFDLLVCMDESNREDILAMGAPGDRVSLLLDYDDRTHLSEVPDPYFGAEDGFGAVYRLVNNACDKLIDDIIANRKS